MIELQSANIETDQSALYLSGNLENGESVSVVIDLEKLKDVSIETSSNHTYITLQWREKRNDR